MNLVSAPAPTPFPATVPFVASVRPQPDRSLDEIRREALAELASLARNVRYDMQRPRMITEGYALELGMKLLEIVDHSMELSVRDWDQIAEALQ